MPQVFRRPAYPLVVASSSNILDQHQALTPRTKQFTSRIPNQTSPKNELFIHEEPGEVGLGIKGVGQTQAKNIHCFPLSVEQQYTKSFRGNAKAPWAVAKLQENSSRRLPPKHMGVGTSAQGTLQSLHGKDTSRTLHDEVYSSATVHQTSLAEW